MSRLRLGELTGDEGEMLEVDVARLRRHTHIRGVSGAGKSRFLTDLLIQLVEMAWRGEALGLALLDPVGEVYEALRSYLSARYLQAWLAERGLPPALRARRARERKARFSKVSMVPLDEPDCGGWRYGALQKPPWMSVGETVGDFLRCVERVIGDLSEMRRLQNVLRAVLSILVETGGATLRDAVDFLMLDSQDIDQYIERLERKRAAGRLGVMVRPDYIRVYLTQFFGSSSQRERRELVQSTFNLLGVFLADERAATFLGSPRGNLDLEKVVNGGKILLVKLPAGIDLNTQRVLGAMLINRIELVCRRRDVPTVKAGGYPDFFLAVDEFQSFVSPQWSDTISQLRNYRLGLVLSHQTSSQRGLGDSDEGKALLASIVANSSTRVYFRLDLAADAELVAREVFRPRGQLVARELVERSVGRGQTWTAGISSSIGEQVSRATSSSQGRTVSLSLGEGQTVAFSEAQGISTTQSESCSVSVGQGWARCVAHGVSITQTDAKTVVRSVSQAQGAASSQGLTLSQGVSEGSATGTLEGWRF